MHESTYVLFKINIKWSCPKNACFEIIFKTSGNKLSFLEQCCLFFQQKDVLAFTLGISDNRIRFSKVSDLQNNLKMSRLQQSIHIYSEKSRKLLHAKCQDIESKQHDKKINIKEINIVLIILNARKLA